GVVLASIAFHVRELTRDSLVLEGRGLAPRNDDFALVGELLQLQHRVPDRDQQRQGHDGQAEEHATEERSRATDSPPFLFRRSAGYVVQCPVASLRSQASALSTIIRKSS